MAELGEEIFFELQNLIFFFVFLGRIFSKKFQVIGEDVLSGDKGFGGAVKLVIDKAGTKETESSGW